MEVTTNCDNSKESQKMIFELLEADQPDRDRHPDSDSKFWNWFDKVEAVSNTFPKIKNIASPNLISGKINCGVYFFCQGFIIEIRPNVRL